jgi:hypothetical protein
MVQTELQCRARFGIWVGESTASRLSLIGAVWRKAGIVPRRRVMSVMMSSRGAGCARPTTPPPHTQQMPAPRFGPLAICFKSNTSATRQRASFPKGRRDPVARAMQAAMFEAAGGLGYAVSERACIGSLIGNRLVVRLCPVRDIGSCGGAV